MKKCISCASDLSPQALFCEKCGASQPVEERIDTSGVDSPVHNATSATDKTQVDTPLIPPPPPLIPPPPPLQSNEEEEKERKNEDLDLPIAELSESKQAETGSMGQIESQVHGSHHQPEAVHGPHHQPEAVHGSHHQPEAVHGSHHQPEAVHGPHHQPESQVHGSHHQPETAHGSHHQQPVTHTTKTIAKIGTTATKTGTALVGKWVLITVIAVTILGASGVGVALAFHLFTPQPVMGVVSAYNAHGLPVVTDGTTLHISGQKFAANSSITFLLDNTAINQTQPTRSDAHGNFTTNLAVTSAWRLGRHTLTAHDADNIKTTSGVEIDIVQPGQSNTPGPNGAPPDDASFTILLNVQATVDTYGTPDNYTYKLIVTGHPDPAGGTACASGDDGTSISTQSPSIDNTATLYRTRTYSCSGTYKGGAVSYTETLESEALTTSNGNTCRLNNPEVHLKITGSYTDQHDFSGQLEYFSNLPSAYTCNNYTYQEFGETGTWIGTVSQSS